MTFCLEPELGTKPIPALSCIWKLTDIGHSVVIFSCQTRLAEHLLFYSFVTTSLDINLTSKRVMYSVRQHDIGLSICLSTTLVSPLYRLIGLHIASVSTEFGTCVSIP